MDSPFLYKRNRRILIPLHLIAIVTGPYTTKNKPIIEDKRLDRARPVLYLDRRTYRGDPPAWLPSFWAKPGMYPLPPESIQIIQMVSSLPFDRNAVTPSSSSTTTSNAANAAAATNAGAVHPASVGMFTQPLFPNNNFYQQQQANMYYGGAGNMMIGPTHPMMPMNGMMSQLLQQQQFQQMLQYQQLHQQQQQQQQQQHLQAMSNPSISSPVPQSLSPSSSSYTQRKPINTLIPMTSPLSYLQAPAIASLKESKPKKQPHQTPPSPSTSISAPPKVQRKQVTSIKGKRRVRFTDAKPQVKIFIPDSHWSEEEDTTEGGNVNYNDHDNGEDNYYDDIGNGNGGHYRTQQASMYDHDVDDEEYYDDDDTEYSGAYDHYDESEYDQRHYPDHYYNNSHNGDDHDDDGDYDGYDPHDEDDVDDQDGQYASNTRRPTMPRAPRYQRQRHQHYMDDGDDYADDRLMGHPGTDLGSGYHYYDDDHHDDRQKDEDDYYYWDDEVDDGEPEEIPRPWSTGRYMDYERSSLRHVQHHHQQGPLYYSPTQRRVTRHSSARTASSRGPPPPAALEQHDSPLVRRSTATAATTAAPSTNPRMWQPSRGSHLQQQWNTTVSRSSSAGASTSRRYRSVNS